MRSLTEGERNTLPRGWVRQAVMGVLKWREAPAGRADTLHKGTTLQTPSAQRQLSTSSDTGGDYSHHHHSHHRESRPLSHNNNNHPKHPSPVPSTPPATAPASPHQLLAGQSRRTLQEILARPPPYPMVAIGARGGYWVDPPTQDTPTDGDSGGEGQSGGNCGAATWRSKIETDDTAKCYRRFFVGREHSTLISHDDQLGPVLLSIKPEHIAGQDHLRLLLRLRTGTMHELLPASCLGSANAAPARVARLLNEQLTCEHFTAALHPRASQLVAAYDEHVLVSQFKFGVLLQRKGQVTEEELFGNEGGTEEWEHFLGLLGRRIRLKDHKGYRGGLDIHNGHTGDEAVYEVFREREIMFHVSTLLPYTDGDPQQLQRKRHIGNDIVAVVFQEDNTPFSPDMIASHFLHTFIVVQVLDKGTPERRYKVSVTARDDVPFFGPTLPTPAIFRHGPEFKEFLLTKLINAENACYKAEKFAKLELRTRASLLQTLTDDLKEKTAEFLGGSPSPVPGTPKSDSGPGSRFIDTVKKAWSSRVKSSQSVDHSLSTSASTTTVNGHEKLGKKTSQPIIAESTPSSTRSVSKSSLSSTSRPSPPASTPPSSPDLTAHAPPSRGAGGGGSDASSLASSSDGELIGDGGEAGEGAYPDSDTGLESMSSAETARGGGGGGCGRCGAGSGQSDGGSGSKALEGLVQEVTRLKCDKLDLLRQNVNCQRDIKRLREKELNLQGELAVATKEILRLRELLKDYSHGDKSPII